MLVGKSDVLKDGEEAVLAVQPPDQLGDRVQASERMQRPAVVTGGKIGGTHHRERGGCQHGLGSNAVAQLLQYPVKDLSRGRLFDELDQWLDGIGILDACVHHGLLVAASAKSRRRWSASPCRVHSTPTWGAGNTRVFVPGVCSDGKAPVSIRSFVKEVVAQLTLRAPSDHMCRDSRTFGQRFLVVAAVGEDAPLTPRRPRTGANVAMQHCAHAAFQN